MHADAFRADLQDGAVDGADGGIGGHPEDMLSDLRVVMQDGSGQRAGHQGAVRVVGPVRERFGHGAEAGGLGQAEDFRTREAQDGQVRVNRLDGVDDGLGLCGVRHDRVVEPAVRLDVGDLAAFCGGQRLQRPDLVDDVVREFDRVDVQEAAAESGQVPVADVGANHDAGGNRLAAGPADHAGVPGVESAGHVGAGDRAEHRRVVAQGPASERLANVAVQVNGCHL